MDGFAFDEVTVQPVKLHAVEAMRRVLERSEEKVTLVPIGPLTNLALLFVQYPEVKEKIEEIVLMGGAFLRGNRVQHLCGPRGGRYCVPFRPAHCDVRSGAGKYGPDHRPHGGCGPGQ